MPGNNTENDLTTVAIVGRPNVGKSTLFNRLAGRRLALVHDQPGVTRDRREAVVEFLGLKFRLVDTPGLIDEDTKTLSVTLASAMREQSLMAIQNAGVLLLVVDGQEGCTPYDYELANLLRRHKKPTFVLVNKSEGKNGLQGWADAATLGLGEPVPISAEHGLGMADLQQILESYVSETSVEEWTEEKPDKPLRLAIMGRPNVGKSTLVNSFIGENRQLTADIPGVTRDAITLNWHYQDRAIELVDTAGIRRQSRVDQSVERLAVMDAERTLRFAEVVVLVIDGSVPLDQLIEKQDLTLASQIIEEGRGLVLAINKWDRVKNKNSLLVHLQHQLDRHFAQARGIPCIPISALNQKNLSTLMDQVLKIEQSWNRRFKTPDLNRWLREATESHSPPAIAGRRIRLKYILQTKSRPPTFLVFCTKADEVPESYRRYLLNSLRDTFDIPGIPLRMSFRASKNPYTS